MVSRKVSSYYAACIIRLLGQNVAFPWQLHPAAASIARGVISSTHAKGLVLVATYRPHGCSGCIPQGQYFKVWGSGWLRELKLPCYGVLTRGRDPSTSLPRHEPPAYSTVYTCWPYPRGVSDKSVKPPCIKPIFCMGVGLYTIPFALQIFPPLPLLLHKSGCHRPWKSQSMQVPTQKGKLPCRLPRPSAI